MAKVLSAIDYIKFLYIAYGSNFELETQIMLAGDLGYIDSDMLEGIKDDIHEVERMLKGLNKIIRKQTLESLNPRILYHFLPTNWEKNLFYNLLALASAKD